MATIENINLEARALVDADTTTFPDATLLRRINMAYEEVVGRLIALNENWKFDDSNYTDLPIGSGDLVSGQQDYSFAASLLMIERVEVLDVNGDSHKLKPIDEKDITEALSEYKSGGGLPEEYARRGHSVFLYPYPVTASVTLTSGLKIYFKRTASIYTAAEVTTGTKEPGFPSPYHYLLAYKAALPYALTYKKDRVQMIREEIFRMESELFTLATNKDDDKVSQMIPMQENNR